MQKKIEMRWILRKENSKIRKQTKTIFDIFDNIPNTENGKHFGLIYVQYSITYIGTSEA